MMKPPLAAGAQTMRLAWCEVVGGTQATRNVILLPPVALVDASAHPTPDSMPSAVNGRPQQVLLARQQNIATHFVLCADPSRIVHPQRGHKSRLERFFKRHGLRIVNVSCGPTASGGRDSSLNG